MGSRMVKHLLEAGNSVVVYDSNQVCAGAYYRAQKTTFIAYAGNVSVLCVSRFDLAAVSTR